ncbi:MAG: purine-binding chemotaxis protein CheW [Spirochaetales bacterium]|nr:MAG: purine-binding chemotaxis protein CheW [Spirochaetales bacterium]
MKSVIFTLGDKEYGVDISEVREVIRLRPITRIPDTADFVEGVISLRGKVVPLINLRVRLGMDKTVLPKTGRIIITRVDSHSVGVIVDSVADVVSLDQASVTPPDEMLKDAEYLVGVARIGERLIIMTDIGKLLRGDIGSHIKKVHDRVEIRKKE